MRAMLMNRLRTKNNNKISVFHSNAATCSSEQEHGLAIELTQRKLTHRRTHLSFSVHGREYGEITHTLTKKGFFVMKTHILYTRIHPEIKREIAENAHLYYNSVNPRSVLVSHFIVRFR